MTKATEWGKQDASAHKARQKSHHYAHMLRMRRQNLDQLKLVTMGYKQELNRGLSWANNAGSAMCLMTAFLTADYYSVLGLYYGGPVALIWGWVAAALSMLCVAACIAELASAFPTSGGLYYFAFVLAPPRRRAFLAWLTGGLNLLGQVTCTMAAQYAFTTFFITIVSLHLSGHDEGPGWKPTQPQLVGVYAAMMVLHASMCCIHQRFTAWTLSFGTFINIIAPLTFMVVLLAVAPAKQSASDAFLEWMDNSEFHGITSLGYIAMMSTLMCQWTMCVFDSSAHLIEETIVADRTASWAMFSSVGVSGVLGFLILLVMNVCMQSVDNLFDPDSVTGGRAMAQLVWDVFKARYGTGLGGLPILYLPLLALFLCPVAALTSNGRMLYAFSRDDAMAGSRFWKRLNKRQLPVNGTWLMASVALGLGVLAIYYPQANYGLNALMVIAMNLTFLIPIALRLTHDTYGFIPGPFSLGRWSKPLGCYSVAWLVFSTVAFCLPPSYPVTTETYNLAPVMLGIALFCAPCLWWLSARLSSFTGPKPNLGQEHNDKTTQEAKMMDERQEEDHDHSSPQHQVSRIRSSTASARVGKGAPVLHSYRPSDNGAHSSRHRTSTMTGAMEEAIQICEGRWNAVEAVLPSCDETAPSVSDEALNAKTTATRALRKQVSRSATFTAGAPSFVGWNKHLAESSLQLRKSGHQPAIAEDDTGSVGGTRMSGRARDASGLLGLDHAGSSDSGSVGGRLSTRFARPPPTTLAGELSAALSRAQANTLQGPRSNHVQPK